MSEGFVVWFTGLSGTGKSTLTSLLAARIRAHGVHVEVLDGDEVRTHLSKGLGFSREDRDTNTRRIGFVAKLLVRAGACVMTASISPYKETREEQRRKIGRFVEVYLKCPIPVLADRDPKGLYKKALAGEIANFTGINDPYEEPENPEVTIDTDRTEPEEAVASIFEAIEALGYLDQPRPSQRARRPHGEPLDVLRVEKIELGPEEKIVVEQDVELRWIASGLFGPVAGPMGSRDLSRVKKDARLENGLLFDRPLSLALAGNRRKPKIGEIVSLVGSNGAALARLEVRDLFDAQQTEGGPRIALVGGVFTHSTFAETGIAKAARDEHYPATSVAGAFVREAPSPEGRERIHQALKSHTAVVLVDATSEGIDAALFEGMKILRLPAIATTPLTRLVALVNAGVSHVLALGDDSFVPEEATELGLIVLPPPPEEAG